MQNDDDSSLYGGGLDLPGMRRGKTEIDVIRDWFVNIFQPVEKTADLVVTDFKFEQLKQQQQQQKQQQQQRGRQPRLYNSGSFNGSSGSFSRNGNGGGVSTSENEGVNGRNGAGGGFSSDDACLDSSDGALGGVAPPFRVLKKADVELKVGGKPKQYSVVIKVLPTDDPGEKVPLNIG